jgi:aspartyl-tRNA(Asn)/glutamyl-tRNA(Gln) amidotransferase subunit C
MIYQQELIMKITREEVLHVADLARLELDDDAIDTFARQIDEILEYMDTLNGVDTEGVRPTSHAIFLSNAFREDETQIQLNNDTALSNAPEKEDGSFTVPKIIG